ncbi:hypothetical protein JMUB3870_1078 [Leptotrichia trevisanii]|uniref:Uncharacterized protein n=1 Tax=Leptotrichia trevisanii TaxID=109328 RepID=A0A510K018_9FUSO|nr:hypothetical protein JMUB3870_1078 [Leptotrichia trevisanii]
MENKTSKEKIYNTNCAIKIETLYQAQWQEYKFTIQIVLLKLLKVLDQDIITKNLQYKLCY